MEYIIAGLTKQKNYWLKNEENIMLNQAFPRSRLKVIEAENGPEGDVQVEEILNHRNRRGRIEYLVKWTHLPEYETSWESEDTLEDNVAIQNYWSTLTGDDVYSNFERPENAQIRKENKKELKDDPTYYPPKLPCKPFKELYSSDSENDVAGQPSMKETTNDIKNSVISPPLEGISTLSHRIRRKPRVDYTLSFPR